MTFGPFLRAVFVLQKYDKRNLEYVNLHSIFVSTKQTKRMKTINNYTASFEGQNGATVSINGKTEESAVAALKRFYIIAPGTEITVRCNFNSVPPKTIFA